VFTGVQLLHPRLFAGAPEGPFSLLRLYDEAEAAGRLSGIVHDGDWHHIGTPAGLAVAEARLSPAPGGGPSPRPPGPRPARPEGGLRGSGRAGG
jgi:MurNAc alpha-1-phosphate uridylyltransferase